MATKKQTTVEIPFGIAHSNFYVKSIVRDYLIDVSSDEEKVCKLHSDINLILRQKTLHREIGIPALRDYVTSLEFVQSDKHDYSDEELLSLIPPRDVNNLTTAFEYTRYLKENEKQMKQRYNELKQFKSDRENYLKKYSPKDE